MMKLTHKFADNIPKDLEDGVIYISMEYATAIHKCCSGCGEEIVTPLSPTDWQLSFDGQSVSLYPSIGNWNLPCQSHYWIKNNEVEWAPTWSKKQIERGQKREQSEKENYYNRKRGKSFFGFFK